MPRRTRSKSPNSGNVCKYPVGSAVVNAKRSESVSTRQGGATNTRVERSSIVEVVEALWNDMEFPKDELGYVKSVFDTEQLRQLSGILFGVMNKQEEIRRLEIQCRSSIQELYALRDRAILAVSTGLVNKGFQSTLASCILRTRSLLIELGIEEQILSKIVLPKTTKFRQSSVWEIFSNLSSTYSQSSSSSDRSDNSKNAKETDSVSTSPQPIFSSDIRMLALCPFREAVNPPKGTVPRAHLFGALSYSILSAALCFLGPRPHPATFDMGTALSLLLGCGKSAASFISHCKGICNSGISMNRIGNRKYATNSAETTFNDISTDTTFLELQNRGINNSYKLREEYNISSCLEKKINGLIDWSEREAESVLFWACNSLSGKNTNYTESMEKILADEDSAGIRRHSVRMDKIIRYNSNVYLKEWNKDVNKKTTSLSEKEDLIGERLRIYSRIIVEQQMKLDLGMNVVVDKTYISDQGLNGGYRKNSSITEDRQNGRSYNSKDQKYGKERNSPINERGKKKYNYVNTYNETKIVRSEKIEGNKSGGSVRKGNKRSTASKNDNYIKDILDEKCLASINDQNDEYNNRNDNKKDKINHLQYSSSYNTDSRDADNEYGDKFDTEDGIEVKQPDNLSGFTNTDNEFGEKPFAQHNHNNITQAMESENNNMSSSEQRQTKVINRVFTDQNRYSNKKKQDDDDFISSNPNDNSSSESSSFQEQQHIRGDDDAFGFNEVPDMKQGNGTTGENYNSSGFESLSAEGDKDDGDNHKKPDIMMAANNDLYDDSFRYNNYGKDNIETVGNTNNLNNTQNMDIYNSGLQNNNLSGEYMSDSWS